MFLRSPQDLQPISGGSTKPGVPRAWPPPLLCQISFLHTASRSLWGVWRSRGMKTNEVKYNHSSPSNSQAAQIRLWRRAVICLSSKLVQSGSPFLHWNTHDWSVLGERSIITLLHLGHHCQIEGLGRSHFTRGKYFYSATAKVQAASSPWSRRGAKHPLAFCLLRKMVWIQECEGRREMSRRFLGMHSFLSQCKQPDVEGSTFYHAWCNAGEDEELQMGENGRS